MHRVVHSHRSLSKSRRNEVEFPLVIDHVTRGEDPVHIGRHELIDLDAVLLDFQSPSLDWAKVRLEAEAGQHDITLDGLVLTGGYSNIEPRRYNGTNRDAEALRDLDRDETTARLIHAAVAAACPILGICRGLQELNVAFGGTLCEKLHEREEGLDHREQGETLEDNYAASHDIAISPGSHLAEILGTNSTQVNSLHAQGIDQLGDGLVAEARSPDGIVEAIRAPEVSAFTVAVQWHPEWRATETPSSKAIFAAFGDACRERARARRGSGRQ